jgi:hypothetical protein
MVPSEGSLLVLDGADNGRVYGRRFPLGALMWHQVFVSPPILAMGGNLISGRYIGKMVAFHAMTLLESSFL